MDYFTMEQGIHGNSTTILWTYDEYARVYRVWEAGWPADTFDVYESGAFNRIKDAVALLSPYGVRLVEHEE